MSHDQSAQRSSYKVLLIEDNPADTDLIIMAIGRADAMFQVHSVTKLNDGLAAIHGDDWNVILSDLSLPDSQGLDTVRALRRHAPNVPNIVLTSLSSDETALKALDEGAQDYLVKDNVTTEILQRAIRYAIQRQKNSEMRRLIENLREHEQLLERKNRRLEKLYKTAHRFVDNVSHEFRTPLTVIKEYVSLVRDGVVGGLNEEQGQMLDVVSDRADDLNNIVDDMLDISKLEAGMLGIWRKNCAVADIIHHIRPSLQKKSSVKDVEIEFAVLADLPQVFCDDEKIGRVIVNLTTNAIKFSGDPGKVLVRAEFDASQREVLISVIDNGSGISKENLKAIFQRFKQVGGNPRGSTKGFGLGLNIAKELVDLNLGEINVNSELGRGSTFSFSIPIADPVEVVRRYIEKIQRLHNGSSVVSLLTAHIEESTTDGKEMNGFLNLLLRRNDLLFRIDHRQWLLLLPVTKHELPKFLKRAEKVRAEANKNRPHGPLPALHMKAAGNWNVKNNAGELLANVEQAMRVSEVAYA